MNDPLEMRKLVKDLIADLFILGILIAFFALSLGYSVRARMIPLIISSLGIVSMLVEMFVRFVLKREAPMAIDSAELFGADKKEDEFRAQSEAKEIVETKHGGKLHEIVLWTLGMGAMLFLFGFQVTSFAYPAIYLIFGNTRMAWWKAVLVGALTWLSIFLLFSVLLNLPFFKGILFGGEL
jgi:hypothetical protein